MLHFYTLYIRKRKQERSNIVNMQRHTTENSINKSRANADRINKLGLKLRAKRHSRQQDETILKPSTES